MSALASPELRYNPITLDWVIMAAARGRRPDDFHKEIPEPRPIQAPYSEGCPFCPGNEKQTDPEILRDAAPDGKWAVRVLPNKFAAFTPTPELHRQAHESFRSMAAAGAHEVVVEHPRHDLALADMDVPHLATILRVYRARYMELKKLAHVRGIVVFKNHGERAGSSLLHPHSQIIAAPVVSCQVRMRLHEARRFHEVHGECLYCRVMADELKAGERVVETSRSFTAFVPYASLSPYHTWIFPTTHAPSYDSITDEQIEELATVLKRLLVRLRTAAGDPDYNFTIRSAPVGEESACCFHWYLAVVPRLSHLAGFELGSGTYINSLPSEESAARLRQVRLGEGQDGGIAQG
ncbi:galactose-1-phosphate uridylyltransferase [Roseimicrobium gellanilyticum]|nr:galactose-1-phosphate uridylyltransferase [Roseimicrobium gellanilyticum]